MRPVPPLSAEEASALVGEPVLGVEALGGLTNANYRLDRAGGPVVLRRLLREGGSLRREAALADLLAERLPVPRYLRVERDWALVEHAPGVPLARALPADRRALARRLGALLARLHAVRFDRAGFLDEGLQVATPVDLGPAGFAALVTEWALEGPGRRRLGEGLARGLEGLLRRESGRLEGDHCLVHADFDVENLLVDQGEVTAILDWEFAFSGPPLLDLGHVLRPPLGLEVAPWLEEGYGPLPPDWPRTAVLLDLLNWAQFLSRDLPAEVHEAARERIRWTLDLP